ncbi:hypothetical protein BJY00DRAFT_234795 [Aspergillus carlsbadensis]|nr:hypothetical protein BJY00DRAFT_234795 [Aspergillus carlsbadensis]
MSLVFYLLDSTVSRQCQCNGYNPSTSSKCKDCTKSHDKCNLCTNDADLARTQMMGSLDYENQQPGTIGFPRPDMIGWWLCCQCGNLVNPTLSNGQCPSCGHEQCSYCSPY